MTTPELLGLAAAMHADDAAPLRLRKGVVVRELAIHDGITRQQQVRVRLAGSTTELDVRALDGVVRGDSVWLLQQGPVLLCWRSAASYPNSTRFVSSLNAWLPAGFYETVNSTDAPTTGWWHVVQTRHTNDSAWGWQVAYEMQGGRVFSRRNVNGADPTVAANWTPWSEGFGGSGWFSVASVGFAAPFGQYAGQTTVGQDWTARYLKRGGVVFMQGLAHRTDGTDVAGGTVFTLPAGFRPANGVTMLNTLAAQGHARLDVQPSGAVILAETRGPVIINSGAGGWFSLQGQWPAEG